MAAPNSADGGHEEGRAATLAAHAVQPTATSGDRERTINELVARADEQREPLERVRTTFQRRLRRRSDDFEATQGLRNVEGALARLRREDPPSLRGEGG